MKKPFPQVLKGAATAAGKQDRRVGLGTGPKPKPITMPKMPWDEPAAPQHKIIKKT